MSAARIATVIDTDPGVDDSIALLAALAAPELDIRAITVTHGNVELDKAVLNARRICALAGRRDVPIHAGAARPLLRDPYRGKFHGATGVGPLALPQPEVEIQAEHAVTAIARLLRDGARGAGPKITLCTIGPLTNVALALAQDPSLAGGDREDRDDGRRLHDRRQSHADRRVQHPRRSARGEDRVLIGRADRDGGARRHAQGDGDPGARRQPARAARSRDRGGRRAARLLRSQKSARYGSDGAPLHDPCAVLYLLAPQLFESRRTHVEICCEEGPAFGQTIADWWSVTGHAPNADVLVGVDVERFFAKLGELLGSYA